MRHTLISHFKKKKEKKNDSTRLESMNLDRIHTFNNLSHEIDVSC